MAGKQNSCENNKKNLRIKKVDQNSTRLDRIETKLDLMQQTLADLARIDERQDSLEQRINRHELRLDLIEQMGQKTSDEVIKIGGKGVVIERAAWILFAATVASASHFF